MKQEILVAGFGGQGVLLMGRLIAEAALNEGYFATWFPSYGPEMRGGTANCTTIFSSEEIGAPIAAQYDVVIAMNQPSMEKFISRVKPGGHLLIDSSMVPIKAGRADIHTHYIPCREIASRIASERVSNVVMLGAFLALESKPGRDAYATAIYSLIGEKKPAMVKSNLEALDAGAESIASHLVSA